ncbi:uncharacterized protein C8Q71DRAFT_862466 [Rhodofomes roseus]|uniref:Uncharacterized protein n=1 Tax=Rhodofomes roseus TaxID=34475 RepID=A0ABQ8K1B9_9APHY|nr:uncharacterized protein C8Q71DRAFT_862466 [Rhodofomes roseus]KAH9830456.1 hypothetical protein C8Q71DRAFT_862466 [Rhodofomes roseus]
MSSGAMQSNVGNRQVYEDGDQRPHGHSGGPAPGGKLPHRAQDPQDTRYTYISSSPYTELTPTLTLHRSELTMQNRQKHDEKKAREAERAAAGQTVKDPLAPATRQGHEPSRGAQVDAELKAEDEALLAQKVKEKGQWGPKVNDVE